MVNTKYIAAQGKCTNISIRGCCIITPNSGPLPDTLEDFWKMIFEIKLQTIVMLTKCFEERVSYFTIHIAQMILSIGNLDILLVVFSVIVFPHYNPI